MTYKEIINKIENGQHFSFSRYGDGELSCMFGKKGHNCDGHEYFEDLGLRLNEAFLDPRGVIGMQRLGYEMYKDQLGPNIWADADVFHKASMRGELKELFDLLIWLNVIIVGPHHLRKLEIYKHFIEVPLRNAWKDYDNIREQVKRNIDPGDIVLYCCGMMSEVLIWDMYSDDITQIDIGSALDPYVGVRSRNYHKKL